MKQINLETINKILKVYEGYIVGDIFNNIIELWKEDHHGLPKDRIVLNNTISSISDDIIIYRCTWSGMEVDHAEAFGYTLNITRDVKYWAILDKQLIGWDLLIAYELMAYNKITKEFSSYDIELNNIERRCSG